MLTSAAAAHSAPLKSESKSGCHDRFWNGNVRPSIDTRTAAALSAVIASHANGSERLLVSAQMLSPSPKAAASSVQVFFSVSCEGGVGSGGGVTGGGAIAPPPPDVAGAGVAGSQAVMVMVTVAAASNIMAVGRSRSAADLITSQSLLLRFRAACYRLRRRSVNARARNGITCPTP